MIVENNQHSADDDSVDGDHDSAYNPAENDSDNDDDDINDYDADNDRHETDDNNIDDPDKADAPILFSRPAFTVVGGTTGVNRNKATLLDEDEEED